MLLLTKSSSNDVTVIIGAGALGIIGQDLDTSGDTTVVIEPGSLGLTGLTTLINAGPNYIPIGHGPIGLVGRDYRSGAPNVFRLRSRHRRFYA